MVHPGYVDVPVRLRIAIEVERVFLNLVLKRTGREDITQFDQA